MTTPDLIFGLATLALTIGGGYMALRLKPLEKSDEDQEKATELLRTDMERRLTALHDDMKEDREKFERRIGDIERSYLSRADLAAAIRDLRESNDRGVERIEKGFLALGSKVDHLAERVGKVESAS